MFLKIVIEKQNETCTLLSFLYIMFSISPNLYGCGYIYIYISNNKYRFFPIVYCRATVHFSKMVLYWCICQSIYSAPIRYMFTFHTYHVLPRCFICLRLYSFFILMLDKPTIIYTQKKNMLLFRYFFFHTKYDDRNSLCCV